MSAHSHSHSNRNTGDPLMDTAAHHNLETVIAPWVSTFKSFLRSAAAKHNGQSSTAALDGPVDESNPAPSYPFTLSTVSVSEFTDERTGETKSFVRPHARTCMFRGFAFTPNSGILTVTTDKRMAKFDQIVRPLTHGAFEACFYFENDLVQFRIAGSCKLAFLNHSGEVYLSDPAKGTEEPADDSVASEFYKSWTVLSPAMKLSFCKPPPGAEFSQEHFEQLEKVEKATNNVRNGEEIPEEFMAEGKKNFVLIMCSPELVDFTNVSGIGQRILFERAGEYVWTFKEICP
ncbi:pyridoxamine 5'-phosphate oxidase-domain-containing protein [Myxozyma melibiosi]|uniref:Pyridoxamine 5'-phosphate oxidase-domain-containing protein n=1 Tax=Myxozyma melibiosi TaxID=54550 RepID=A0ABR1F251_9ASCO